MRALVFDTDGPDGERRWAIACGAILEVLPIVRWRQIPDTPDWIRGVFERQRSLHPLLDLSRRLGGSLASPRLGSRIVLVRLAPERADGGLGGLLLNGVLGIETIDWTSTKGGTAFACALDSPFGPIVPHYETTVQLLHPERLLVGDDRTRLFPEFAEALSELSSSAAPGSDEEPNSR
jgi:chemotaxis signal transduction protein